MSTLYKYIVNYVTPWRQFLFHLIKKEEFWAMKVIFLNDLLGDLGHALRLVCFFYGHKKVDVIKMILI